MSEKEAPRLAVVQGIYNPRSKKRDAGTIEWWEHEQAWEAYARKYGRSQSAEVINTRGGFGYEELITLLGHAPTTWKPRA